MGTGKKIKHCPDCGASQYSYRYDGISKRCFNCGRDNKMEEKVKLVQSIKRNDPENKSPSGGLNYFTAEWLKEVEDYRISREWTKTASRGGCNQQSEERKDGFTSAEALP